MVDVLLSTRYTVYLCILLILDYYKQYLLFMSVV